MSGKDFRRVASVPNLYLVDTANVSQRLFSLLLGAPYIFIAAAKNLLQGPLSAKTICA